MVNDTRPQDMLMLQRAICAFLDSWQLQIFDFLLIIASLLVPNLFILCSIAPQYDVFLNTGLIFIMAVFLIELGLNLSCRSKSCWIYCSIDLISVSTIALELTWIAAKVDLYTLPSRSAVDQENLSIFWQALCLMRLLRLVKIVFVVGFLSRKALMFSKQIPESNKVQLSGIGRKVTNSLITLFALLIVAFSASYTLMRYLGTEETLYTSAIFSMYQLGIGQERIQRHELSIIADMLPKFAAHMGSREKPVALRAFGYTWQFVNQRDWPIRSWSVIELSSTYLEDLQGSAPKISLFVDITDYQRDEAKNELISIGIIILLISLFSCAINAMIFVSISRPLERMYDLIHLHASILVRDLDQAIKDVDEDESVDEDRDMATLAAAVSKVLKVVTNTAILEGNNVYNIPDHVLTQIDDQTLDWLATMTDIQVPRPDAKDNKRRSKRPSRMSKIGQIKNLFSNKVDSIAFVESKPGNQTPVDMQPKQVVPLPVRCHAYGSLIYTREFNVLELHVDDIVDYICLMFLELGLAVDYELPDQGTGKNSLAIVTVSRLRAFIAAIHKRYSKENTYHNFYHCADVTHATFLLIDMVRHPAKLEPLECFALMVAALAHDLEHPGVNNAYLINSKDPMAITYNDVSVLENKHASALFRMVANDPKIDIFEFLDESSWRTVRKLIIASIMHTDMAKHFSMISRLELFLELHSNAIKLSQEIQNNILSQQPACHLGSMNSLYDSQEYSKTMPILFETEEDRLLLHAVILHAADISNQGKPERIAHAWALRVLEEFCSQGDLEKAKGFPVSPMCDRDTNQLEECQLKFIEFVVAPYFALLTKIFPDIGGFLIQSSKNWDFWMDQQQSTTSSGVRDNLICKRHEAAMSIATERRNRIESLRLFNAVQNSSPVVWCQSSDGQEGQPSTTGTQPTVSRRRSSRQGFSDAV